MACAVIKSQNGVHAHAGEAHLAALHLLSVADVVAALGVYKRAGLVAEARLLAAARLPPDHAEQRELRAALSEAAAEKRMDAGLGEPSAATSAERWEGEAQPAQPPSAGEQPAAASRRRYSRAELDALRAAAPAPAPGMLRCLPPALAMQVLQ